ncbi:MAG: haloacid dehalogenase type II [Pseudomonadota bacterium]
MTQAPRILAFDVFGTVVDWCGSVAREVERVLPDVDGGDFARAWRSAYAPSMARVRSGERGWVVLDELHRENLLQVLDEFNIDGLSDEQIDELNHVWHRLDAWPDSVEGLRRLKSKFTICTLSNGNLGLLTDMAKRAHLPWDCILCAEVFRAYKPDPATYRGVANVFDAAPADVMMVAAHQDDLEAARECGLQTAYIERPAEFGESHIKDVSKNDANTYHATDFIELADLLAC